MYTSRLQLTLEELHNKCQFIFHSIKINSESLSQFECIMYDIISFLV